MTVYENITFAERTIRMIASIVLPISTVADPLPPEYSVALNVVAMYLFITALTGVDMVYASINYIGSRIAPSLLVGSYSLR